MILPHAEIFFNRPAEASATTRARRQVARPRTRRSTDSGRPLASYSAQSRRNRLRFIALALIAPDVTFSAKAPR
jgi:hypothetical protein